MPIAGHFHRKPDDGFVRGFDAQSAKRQFQVSVILIFILALAALALGALARFDQPTAPAYPAAVRTSSAHFAETALDIGP